MYRIEVYALGDDNKVEIDTFSNPDTVNQAKYDAEDLLAKGYPSAIIHLVQS